MKTPKLLIVLLICSLMAWAARAADQAPTPRHWYTVYVTVGADTKSFTGSSPLNAGELAGAVVPNGYPVRLEHLRAFFRMNDKSGWHEDKTIVAFFIVPSHVIYFYELAEEPKLIEE